MQKNISNDFFSLNIDSKNLADAIFARVQLCFSITNVSSLVSLCKINLEDINKQVRGQFEDSTGLRVIICLIFPDAGQNFEARMFDEGINYMLKSFASKTIFNNTDIVAISYQDKVPRNAIYQMVAYVQKQKMAAVLHGAIIRLKNKVESIMPQQSQNYKKYILVTGGSRGIGKTAAEILARSGKNIIVTTRKINEKNRTWAQNLANTFQIKVEVMELSLRDQQSCAQLANTIKNRQIQLSGIVHNAAVGTASCLEQVNQHETFQETLIKVNSIGPVQLQFQLQKAGVVDERCCLTIVSSVGGTRPFKEMNTIDNNSKCILDAWAAQLSKKYPLSILYPGCTDTDMFRSSTLDKMNQVQLKDFIQKLPKQMLIQPEIIGQIIEMSQNQVISPYFNLTKISSNCGLQMDYRPWEGKK